MHQIFAAGKPVAGFMMAAGLFRVVLDVDEGGLLSVVSTRSEGAMVKIDERIEALEAKLGQLKVQRQRKEARARTVALRRARGEELRRKILAGAIVLAKVEAGHLEEATLRGWLDGALTREEDRALFDLPPLRGDP
jgi:hypothetical protein